MYTVGRYFCLILSFLFFLNSCGKKYSPEQEKYISTITEERRVKDNEMKDDPSSPFNQDPKVHFSELKYFDPDPGFVFRSKLFEYDNKDTVEVLGTKGEKRKYLKWGFIKFVYENKEYRMNVYKGRSKNNIEYYSLWFTDRTTNNETYGVGRYIDFGLNKDRDFIYTIDFNKAYNPYCAYSSKYSCAVPLKEDYLDIRVSAGEKKFHK